MALKFKYAASSTTVVSLAASLANGANTYNGLTSCTHTLLDNSTDKYPHCRFTWEAQDTFAAAPTAGGTIDIYMTPQDVDSTSDETPEPGSSDILYLGQYIGSIVLDNQDVATRKSVVILNCLMGITSARFNWANASGQTVSYSSNPITLKATPLTVEDA
jgi:hypothetical protein